jgi:AraC-like DNA-binding protein
MRDSGQLFLLIHTGLVNAGLDVDAIYSQLGYSADQLPLRELRTPHQLQVFFWNTVESVTGERDIGLRLCPHLPPYRGEVLEYLMFSSPTFGQGCERVFKYLRLVSDALDVRLERGERLARLVIRSSPERAPALRHTEICTAWEIIEFARGASEGAFKPSALRLSYEARSPVARYESVFGCPVAFEAEHCEVDFDPALLDLPSSRSDPDLLKVHEEVAEKRLSRLQRQDLIEKIEAVIARRLELQTCELDSVARELGMPERRLRFELSQAGTSFTQLLADFRYRLARRLLADTQESVDNIVYLTGFSEPSTFYRAFKRWSGMTPVQYRDRKRGLAEATSNEREPAISKGAPRP